MAEATLPWKNRIVGEGMESPEQLLANPKNWRIHPKHQQDALTGVLDQVGWVQRVLVNQRTGHLIDGHLRVMVAMRREESLIPVTYVSLSIEEEELILATLDPLAGLASVDRDLLAGLLAGIEAGNDEVTRLLEIISQDAGLSISPPPSLDELAAEHGNHDDDLFWPIIRIKVPQETAERFASMMQGATGKDEWQKFDWLLQRVDKTIS